MPSESSLSCPDPKLQLPILYESLIEKYGSILSQYDQAICIIPLTSDCGLNPFRVKQDTLDNSHFLFHAILATSLYHLTRNIDETSSLELMYQHKSTALRLFSEAIGNSPTRRQGVAFLDTALLLIYLDSVNSANGMFNIHLAGVRSIIEMTGGADLLFPRVPKLRAQMAMFIWVDSTVALISRENPILPTSYLEAIIRNGRNDGWDFFSLAGCREELVLAMAKLSHLAALKKNFDDSKGQYYDAAGVDTVEQGLLELSNALPIFNASTEQEASYEAQDQYHCTEAWRIGLLLYIVRVFRWNETYDGPVNLEYLSQIVLDHTRSIRRTSMIQKMVLLPVFLAAAETQVVEYQEFAVEYCTWWTRRSGYKQFKDVATYLQDVWEERGNSVGDDIWWAPVIDRHRKDPQQPKLSQILMG